MSIEPEPAQSQAQAPVPAPIPPPEDEIIEEIPLFFTKNVEDSFYVFQYPSKNTAQSDKPDNVVNCYVKPMHKEFKIQVGLNTDSSNYDHFTGEQMAIIADGRTLEKGDRPLFKRGKMDTITYMSSESILDVNKFVLCVYQDKEVHASPLSSILQMRPILTHFEKEDGRRRAEQKANDLEEEDEEAKAVTVKFSAAGSLKDKISHRLRYTKSKDANDEPWYEAFWHSPDSVNAKMARQKMFSTTQLFSHVMSQKETKYINRLLPSNGMQQAIEALLPPRVHSKRHIKRMPLADQLKVLLKDAKILTFDTIMETLREICGGDVQRDRVLRSLPQVGVLLQGNWVPRSEILYPPDTKSEHNGVESELMTRSRDYVMFKLAHGITLYRRQVITVTQLPPVEALEILQTVAMKNDQKKWELLLPRNAAFEARHEDLVQRQEMTWRALEPKFIEMEREKPTKRVRNRSQRSICSD